MPKLALTQFKSVQVLLEMPLPREARLLIDGIRRNKALPKEAGILKYDFAAGWKDLFSGNLGILLMVGLVFLPLWRLTIFRRASAWFDGVAVFALILVAVPFIVEWTRRKRGFRYVLLTPHYLISTHDKAPVCYEWRYMSEVCIEVDAETESERVKVEDFPLIWDDEKLWERGIERARARAGGGQDLLEARTEVKAVLEAGNRRIVFDYSGEKESVAVPIGVDLRTLAKFVNLYWTKLNPGAKKKGVIYL